MVPGEVRIEHFSSFNYHELTAPLEIDLLAAEGPGE